MWQCFKTVYRHTRESIKMQQSPNAFFKITNAASPHSLPQKPLSQKN